MAQTQRGNKRKRKYFEPETLQKFKMLGSEPTLYISFSNMEKAKFMCSLSWPFINKTSAAIGYVILSGGNRAGLVWVCVLFKRT